MLDVVVVPAPPAFRRRERWTTKWSTFSPFTLNSDGHVLAYKTTGSAKILHRRGGRLLTVRPARAVD